MLIGEFIMNFFIGDEKGAGLIEILIVSGLLIVIFQFLMQSFTNFNKFQGKKENQMAQVALKSYINEAVSCAKTIANWPVSCSDQDTLEIISGADQLLIKNPDDDGFTKIGNFQVKAVCEVCEDCDSVTVNIQSRLVNLNDKPVRDPLTGKKTWVSLYKKIPFPCEFEMGS